MRSVLAVVANIFAHQPFQVPFIEYDDMIEQIFSTAANPAFGDAVLPWASEAGSFGLDAETLHGIAGSGFLGAFRIHRSTVLSEISKPSIFSSP
jgi:hypothetical protein